MSNLSEEEKKAIERIKRQLETTYELRKNKLWYDIEIVLNLIDKQQKEIEELKNITNSYNSYGGNLMNDTKIIIADSRYFLNGTFANKFIKKDKIRDLIDEIEKEHSLIMNNKERSLTTKSINTYAYNATITVLEELLEERN